LHLIWPHVHSKNIVRNGGLHAYEFKWSAEENAKMPASFAEAYPGTTFEVIHSGNYQSFLTPQDSSGDAQHVQ
jgi:hypothetical protein